MLTSCLSGPALNNRLLCVNNTVLASTKYVFGVCFVQADLAVSNLSPQAFGCRMEALGCAIRPQGGTLVMASSLHSSWQ